MDIDDMWDDEEDREQFILKRPASRFATVEEHDAWFGGSNVKCIDESDAGPNFFSYTPEGETAD